MCGIAGVLSRSSDHPPHLDLALKRLHHRGPDDQGDWHDSWVQIGHTRLAILDLSPLGHQPMTDASGRFWITFNGEIYNYLELRHHLSALGHRFGSQSDTEVLVTAYAQWGSACLEHLQGMFAFAIWDREQQRLFLARDRCGEKPLYYHQNADCFYFASELKALIPLLPQVPSLHPAAIDLYLHYQYVPEPLTPLAGIHKLPAAHFLRLDRADWQLQFQRYWSLESITALEVNSGNPGEPIREQLTRAVDLTLRSDVAVGVALSGGIDSGAIAALASRLNQCPLQTFSIGYPGYPIYDERRQAKQLADHLGLPFHDVALETKTLVEIFPQLVAAMDDPIADIAAYGHYAVAQLAAQHGVKVMLSGLGGDEVFWGYSSIVEAVRLTQQRQQLLQQVAPVTASLRLPQALLHHPLYQRLARSPKVPLPVRRLLHFLTTQPLVQQPEQRAILYDLDPDFQTALHHCRSFYSDEFAAQIPEANAYWPVGCDLAACTNIPLKICQLLFDTWLTSNCLALGDRVTMAASVELRLPFLDHRLIELVMGLRQTNPDDQLGHKFWLKAALEGILPQEVLRRPKRGFEPPVRQWLDAILNQYLEGVLHGQLVQLNLFNFSPLGSTLNDLRQQPQTAFLLYKLVLLETWYRTVVLQEA